MSDNIPNLFCAPSLPTLERAAVSGLHNQSALTRCSKIGVRDKLTAGFWQVDVWFLYLKEI
jgi:hypothetical protein